MRSDVLTRYLLTHILAIRRCHGKYSLSGFTDPLPLCLYMAGFLPTKYRLTRASRQHSYFVTAGLVLPIAHHFIVNLMSNVCSPLYNAFCANNISTRRTISKLVSTAIFWRPLLLPARTMIMYGATGKNRFRKIGTSDRRPTLTAQFLQQLVFIA
jgi:hypothetical protein